MTEERDINKLLDNATFKGIRQTDNRATLTFESQGLVYELEFTGIYNPETGTGELDVTLGERR